jgi:hypothetical protein
MQSVLRWSIARWSIANNAAVGKITINYGLFASYSTTLRIPSTTLAVLSKFTLSTVSFGVW